MPHIRAHVRLTTQNDVMDFIRALCDGTSNFYDVENYDGSKCVNARSLLGMLYATAEFPNSLYLVNTTVDGEFPSAIDQFRV